MSEEQVPLNATTCCCHVDEKARERLLRAAADVFDRKGYTAASVREIVEKAGITKPVLYYHFGSKEGILVAILEEGSRMFNDTMKRAVEQHGTARARITAMCQDMFSLFKQNVPAVRVSHAVYFGPREMQPPFDFEKFDSALRQTVLRVIEEGIASGELRQAPVQEMAMAINGVIAGCMDQAINAHGEPMTIEGIPRVIDLLFEGLIPDTARLAAVARKEN